MTLKFTLKWTKIFSLIGIAFIIVADQYTKHKIIENASFLPIDVTSVLKIVLAWNRGISFGILSNIHQWIPEILIVLTSGITLVLIGWLRQAQEGIIIWGLSAVIAGAVGNLIDRIHFRAVIDFLYFHWQGYYWPAFNIADTSITCGVALLLFHQLYLKEIKGS